MINESVLEKEMIHLRTIFITQNYKNEITVKVQLTILKMKTTIMKQNKKQFSYFFHFLENKRHKFYGK